jgi:hypothetical protein
MKKYLSILFLFVYPCLLFAQSNKDTVYIYNYLAGSYACSFAETDINNEALKPISPYIQKGKLYFIFPAAPVKSGSLKPGFEFSLTNDEKRIKGKYQGKNTDTIKENTALVVAGYAEKGNIVITHVFFDEVTLENWMKTIKIIN